MVAETQPIKRVISKRKYAKTNDMVGSGEPLGLMPFNTQDQTELYIEIRKDGSAVNPTPWLGTAFAG